MCLCWTGRQKQAEYFAFKRLFRDYDGRLSFEEFMGEESTIEKLFKNMDKNGDGLVTKEVRLQRRRPLGNWDYGILCGYKNSNSIGTESFKVHCTLHFFSFYDKILTVLTNQFICKRIR